MLLQKLFFRKGKKQNFLKTFLAWLEKRCIELVGPPTHARGRFLPQRDYHTLCVK
jgi:hypothetical protein